jgi:hypothetical protein
MSNFMNICLFVAELFLADRRADITKLIVAFRNFCKHAWKELEEHTPLNYRH